VAVRRRNLAAAALGAATFLGGPLPSAAGEGPAPGLENIRRMTGCYSVTYRFYEDGKHDHFGGKLALGKPIKEAVRVVSESPTAITISHASVAPDGREVPHFHEEWTWQERGGAWTQTVWSRTAQSSSRERRYSCTAPWTQNLWECHAGRAPKPFRDSGAPFGFMRDDYEWLDRFNALLVTERGWIHNERNRKMDAAGRVVAHELGWITYEKLPPEQCAPAKTE
jgi:hypothetical protein